MMGIYGGGMGGGLWILAGLFWIVLIAVIIWLVVRLLPSNDSATDRQVLVQPSALLTRAQGAAPQESPVEIVDRRFARGELDLETYQAHRSALVAAREGER